MKTPKPLGPALLLAGGSFILYGLASPTGITWNHSGEDGAEFAAVGKVLGVSHPTGYPLFSLLLRIASLGGVETAWRATLVTNLAAAAAVFCIALLFVEVARRALLSAGDDETHGSIAAEKAPIAALAGGLCLTLIFAVSPIWWSQAVIIEVYALHVFSVALTLYLALTFDGTRRRLWILAYLAGLGMAHHLQILLVGPSLLILTLTARQAARRRTATPPETSGNLDLKAWLAAGLLFLLPFTLYGVLYVRSAHDPPLDWGNPETMKQLLWVVRGEQYRFRMFTASLAEVLDRGEKVLFHQIPDQFAWTALPLGVIGLAALARSRAAGLLAALAVYLILQLLFGLNYAIPDPDAYFIPVTLAWAALSAAGAAAILSRALPKSPGAAQGRESGGEASPGAARNRKVAWICLGLFLSGPILSIPGSWKKTSLRGDVEAEEYAREATALLPRRAIVLSDGDGRTFGLWYKSITLARSDLTIMYRSLLVWPWYVENLKKLDPDVQAEPTGGTPAEFWRHIITENMPGRPFYTTFVDKWLSSNFVVAPEGRLFRVRALRHPLSQPDEALVWRAIDLSTAANADFRFDPFTPGSTDSSGLFPGLGGGTLYWGSLPFKISRPQSTTGRPSVLTTARLPSFEARLALSPEPTKMIGLAVDGGAIGHWSIKLGEARLHYADGPPTVVEIRSYENVWDYSAEAFEVNLPEDLVIWHGPLNQSLTLLAIPADPDREPRILELTGEGQAGEWGEVAGYTVFAATQWLVGPRPGQ